MKLIFSTSNKERITAGMLALMGAGSLIWGGIAGAPLKFHLGEILLALSFAGAIVLADNYPIHILRGTKVVLINVPIFIAIALLPAPLAIAAVGLGILIANLLSRVKRGLFPRDILIAVGQWMFIAFLGNMILQLSIPSLPEALLRDGLLVICAAETLLVSFLLAGVTQTFILGESFVPTLKSIFKEGFSLELTQYLIAVLGALAAYENLWSLVLLIIPIAITYVAFKNLKETRFETFQILEDMADTVDLRDVYTGGHSKRVVELVHQLLVQLNIQGPEATLIKNAARLHDIGKIGIPDVILMKPEKLTPEEMEIMRSHSQKGASLITKYRDFSRGAQMILHHHERWDGQGYPARLKEYEIPFGARVIAVADSFDAMTSDRPYRRKLTERQALDIFRNDQGQQWDPHIVAAFLTLMAEQSIDENRNINLVPVCGQL